MINFWDSGVVVEAVDTLLQHTFYKEQDLTLVRLALSDVMFDVDDANTAYVTASQLFALLNLENDTVSLMEELMSRISPRWNRTRAVDFTAFIEAVSLARMHHDWHKVRHLHVCKVRMA